MVAMYTIAGRQIGSHYLAIATLATVGGLVSLSMGGGAKKAAQKGPPINASSSDEEKFIQDFLKQADESGKKSNASAEKGDAGR